MADNSILTPGGSGNECINPVNEQIDTSQFLKVDYRLGEFESESDKQIARINLGAAGINDVYDKTSADLKTLIEGCCSTLITSFSTNSEIFSPLHVL